MHKTPISALLAGAALVLATSLSHAQPYPKTTLNVVGNLGITTQSKEL